MRPKGVADGKQVNIPVLVCNRLTIRSDAEVNLSHLLDGGLTA